MFWNKKIRRLEDRITLLETYRRLTESRQIQANCAHPYREVEPGRGYYVVKCAFCGKNLGTYGRQKDAHEAIIKHYTTSSNTEENLP